MQQKSFFGFVMIFSVWGLNAQQLLYPTFSSFSFDRNVSNKMVTCTSGETVTGLKFFNQFLVIEGIYVFKESPDIGTNLVPPSTLRWSVYPNPAKEKFTISNKTTKDEIKVDVFLLSGILVKSLYVPSSSSVEVTDLAEGIYLIKIDDNNSILSSSSYVKLILAN